MFDTGQAETALPWSVRPERSPADPGHIGVISNPRSRAFREGRIRLDAQAAGVPQAAPATPAELQAALADFAARGVGLLAVQGGDGTLREVLTALPAAFGRQPPDIAILAAGKTNLGARVLGTAGLGEAGLARLLDAARRGTLRRRMQPVLEVARPGLAEPPLRGLLFGAGAFTAAKRLADTRVHRRGIHDRLGVALTLAGMTLRAVLRRSDSLRQGVEMQVAVDGRAAKDERHFLLLATTLDRLMLGLWPFFGEGPGGVHWLSVAAPPRRLGGALFAALRGRPWQWMPSAGYRSGRTARLGIRLDTPFVLDGEVFEPGARGILLSAPDQVAFVAP